MCGNEVYLSWESLLEVWSLETVLSYRLNYSSASNFKHFYDDVIRAVAKMSEDANTNIYNIVNRLPEKSDNVCCMLEGLLFTPKKKYSLLKKMWMLYAEQHWTNAIDLKSAVERLYENLCALEFDADHEAIYGMEKYYTVQEYEQLQDKYKIGRKVCGQFLKGKYFSQCLKDRLARIGLQHFLDRIHKYISNSDTSDEEEYKAVEQNGEGSETTKEE
ncbi:hypothetical protein FQA39_LY16492 [Lamprigera yunnana]|nr:hypothetical protein FQA39_LY16492 [Lamprigera yunnana]